MVAVRYTSAHEVATASGNRIRRYLLIAAFLSMGCGGGGVEEHDDVNEQRPRDMCQGFPEVRNALQRPQGIMIHEGFDTD